MKSTMNQTLKAMDSDMTEKISKYQKNLDQRFFTF